MASYDGGHEDVDLLLQEDRTKADTMFEVTYVDLDGEEHLFVKDVPTRKLAYAIRDALNLGLPILREALAGEQCPTCSQGGWGCAGHTRKPSELIGCDEKLN